LIDERAMKNNFASSWRISSSIMAALTLCLSSGGVA